MEEIAPFSEPAMVPGLLPPQPKHSEVACRDRLFLEKVSNSILSNLNQKNFGVESLAKKMYLSVSQLNRKLNALLGRPAGQLIRELRLHFAARLLAHNTGTISEVAQRAGFSDQAHFCRSFKKVFRCTPSHYQKQHIKINLAEFFS